MILDILDNADRYAGLNPRFPAAFAFLRRKDLAELPEGRHDLEDGLYVMVIKGPGRKPEEGLIETHDRYIDIQVALGPTDTVGWRPRAGLGKPMEAPDPRADVAFYQDAPTVWAEIGGGVLGIYFPEDAHLPMIADHDLHKVVVKVRV